MGLDFMNWLNKYKYLLLGTHTVKFSASFVGSAFISGARGGLQSFNIYNPKTVSYCDTSDSLAEAWFRVLKEIPQGTLKWKCF